MSDAPHVVVTREGPVMRMTLNRPEMLNALSPQMAAGLAEHSAEAGADESVRCIVIDGAGGNFCAGGDIGRFKRYAALSGEERAEQVHAMIGKVHACIENLYAAPKPVVASVQGACAGFGLSLALACDLFVCADDATLSLAYTRIGVSPDGGSTYALPRAVGRQRAMRLALLAERFTATEGEQMGIVSHVLPRAEVPAATAKLAARLAASATAALGRTKQLINDSGNATLSAQLHAEEYAFAESAAGAEFAEGVSAFLEKRKPDFGNA